MIRSILLVTGFIISALLFYGCHKKQITQTTNTSSPSEKNGVNQTAIPEIKNAIVNTEIDMTNTGGMYTVDSMKIDNDVLSVFVNYSGGCKEHSFDLYSNGMYAKSLPPQLSLCLKHTNNGDACRKLIIKELKFNISNLKYAGKNTVILKLGDKRVTYATK